jgi:putative ABC transport system permease protein
MIKDYLNYALQSLLHRRVRSWLTMIGIFIGIAAIISLIGLGEGLRLAIRSQFDFLGSDMLSIQASGLQYGPPGTGVVIPLDKELVDKVKKVNGVEVAFNRWIKTTKIEFNSKQIIGYIASVPGGDTRKPFETMLNLKAEEGRLLRDTDAYKVAVGRNFGKSTNPNREAMFGREVTVGDRININGKMFEVVGVLEKKGNFIIDRSMIINEDILFDVFGDDGSTDIIAVKVRDEREIDTVKENIERILRKERDVEKGEENFQVQSSKAIIDTLDSTLAAVNIFIVIIAGISLLVGGIGIMNTMYTSVLERTKEIGIMKAIGARNSTIFILFFVESGFLGMVGGIIGVILGYLLAYGMAFAGRLALGVNLIQASVPFSWVVIALCLSFGLGTIFGVLPALQASKLQPVDSLRSK